MISNCSVSPRTPEPSGTCESPKATTFSPKTFKTQSSKLLSKAFRNLSQLSLLQPVKEEPAEESGSPTTGTLRVRRGQCRPLMVNTSTFNTFGNCHSMDCAIETKIIGPGHERGAMDEKGTRAGPEEILKEMEEILTADFETLTNLIPPNIEDHPSNRDDPFSVERSSRPAMVTPSTVDEIRCIAAEHQFKKLSASSTAGSSMSSGDTHRSPGLVTGHDGEALLKKTTSDIFEKMVAGRIRRGRSDDLSQPDTTVSNPNLLSSEPGTSSKKRSLSKLTDRLKPKIQSMPEPKEETGDLTDMNEPEVKPFDVQTIVRRNREEVIEISS